MTWFDGAVTPSFENISSSELSAALVVSSTFDNLLDLLEFFGDILDGLEASFFATHSSCDDSSS
eukprot:CAMPEP_0203700754 /NCGR_PEP_ID=MMETSP0091-20130426/32693_1 /ASSEMBLY_ACC=CAM_ASM_001089 /TAXON_ID=426623 /ORGANISM="Chaetoceros affinis, Strain CCMP159" /LENGTH=63 /DNA_ID=CAMNT_0050574215 /DNA_START=117 /DNA_END=304 /DNA_ORIENTATION=-